ncbi:MAG TPA: hypothetical protein VF109_03775 [Mycobacteriales bacterium]
MTTADGKAVRRATVRLGALAGVLLLAGLLPWVTGGTLAARLVALPLLLAGVGIGAVAVRLRSVLMAADPADAAYPAPLVERGCDGCACGAGGCGSAAEPTVTEPAGGETTDRAGKPTTAGDETTRAGKPTTAGGIARGRTATDGTATDGTTADAAMDGTATAAAAAAGAGAEQTAG